MAVTEEIDILAPAASRLNPAVLCQEHAFSIIKNRISKPGKDSVLQLR